MPDSIIKDAKEKMEKTVDHLREEYKAVRTGRASISMFDNIKVDYYGAPTPLAGVATLSAPEPRLIVIQPWDPTMIPVIEKAINQSNLGLNPQNDGKLIRLPIPQLTEERRKEIVKVVKKLAEEAKVAVRNIRRDANDQLKKLEKDKEISEDDFKAYQADVQELTDENIKRLDEVLDAKEKDVMEI
ncbi:ribosome recycling factor [Limisalsivibrio acetivorans]|uniref:ribosome recycling factor n=1 Tax=Limisalsivibrio acetivorans TaxID=1304888 RepID=UPI0003B66DFD|nr:ribosome recycling factor [Limisalsivibrio acetivorans]